IKIEMPGAALALAGNGDLLIDIAGAPLRQPAPRIYQTVHGRQIVVPGRYVIEAGQIRFRIGRYDRARALVIDPVLAYSTYVGGAGGDWIRTMGADEDGSLYLTGETTSSPFPSAGSRPPDFQTFVAKLNAEGTSLVWATYVDALGTSAMALGGDRKVYVAGSLKQEDDPSMPNSDGNDAFVSRLSTDGTRVEYFRRLAGRFSAGASAVAVDSTSNAYVVGNAGLDDTTAGNYFPGTPGSFQPQPTTTTEPFFAKLGPGGDVVYFTYLRGAGFPRAIAVRRDGAAVIAGQTESPALPVKNPYQSPAGCTGSRNCGTDGFIIIMKPDPADNDPGSDDPSDLMSATYLGGSGADEFWGVAVNGSDAIFV
ncbi:MAG: SBBP repeat-containing protein, partial [Actinomycetota bacterium]